MYIKSISQNELSEIDNIAASSQAKSFRRGLLRWFARHGRNFAWRESKDPYIIILSEVLLQRTQARQVASNFNDIILQFPTLQMLYSSRYDVVSKTLQPLGLAKRVDTLLSMTKILVEQHTGKIPTNPDQLRSLPGIGRYIASATACFAFSRRIPVVDTNVVRIFIRYFGITSKVKRPHEDGLVWRLAELLLPRRHVKDYNRALIDFAALVCTARKPSCPQCPMIKGCRSALSFSHK